MDQQRGVGIGRVAITQVLQFRRQIPYQLFRFRCVADDVSDLAATPDGLGKGTEIESDYGALQPGGNRLDDLLMRAGMSGRHGFLMQEEPCVSFASR